MAALPVAQFSNYGTSVQVRRWYDIHSWQHAVRAARRRWPRIPLWVWARAGHVETAQDHASAVTPQQAGRVAFDVLLALAERARAEEPAVRRNRDVSGWDGCVVAARRTWPEMPEIIWETIGELPAREGREFFCSQNELAVEVGLLGLDDPPWSRR